MKTIGVLGGFGPEATMVFERQVLQFARDLVPPKFNQGYPPMVTVHLRHPPVLLEDEAPPQHRPRIDPRVLDTAQRLGQWSDFLVIVANTPHLFVGEIAEAAGCEVLSMVDLVVEEIRARAADRVGLLGLGIPLAYVDRFEAEGIEYRTAPDPVIRQLDDAILRTLELSTTDIHRQAAHAAVGALRVEDADPIVLGCTEIPLLLSDDAGAPDLIDPGLLLAEAAVRKAI